MSLFDPECKQVEVRISDILATWDECRERGENPDPAELCRDCPELLDEVTRRIAALRHWNSLADTVVGDAAGLPVAPQPVSPAIVTLNLDDLQFHAQGGLGAIFQAHERGLGRNLAVKFPVTPGSGFAELELQQRFLREARVTAALEHPGIVPVHGLGQDADGRLCYAMRFVTGTALKTAIADYHAARQSQPRKLRRPLHRDVSFRTLLQRFKSACVTVAYAHSRGFLHRDLKPEHILLGDFDVTLVVDWGLTKPCTGNGVTPFPSAGADGQKAACGLGTETGIGTLGFASPEQQAGDWGRVGPASDVFSLGATMYVLLCGVVPFSGSSAAEIMGKVERGDTLPPSRRNSAVPRRLEAICMKALALQPEDRYASAQDLADDIECWLADAPVAAYPDRLNTRIWRWMDRQRIVLCMIVAAAVSGLAVAGSGWHWKRLREVEVRSLAYASAEMSAREGLLTHLPGWATKGLNQLDQARRINTPLRSSATLRTLTAACLGGIDLKPCGRLTSVPAGCLAFSPEGTEVAVGELGGEQACRVLVIDLKTRQVREQSVSTRNLGSDRSGVSDVVFSEDGRFLAAGLGSGTVDFWDLGTPTSRPTIVGQRSARVSGLGFTSHGKGLLAGFQNGDIVLWERGPQEEWREVHGQQLPGRLDQLATSRDGSLVTCVGTFGVASCKTAKLREGLLVSPGSDAACRVAISADARAQALACDAHRTLTINTEASRVALADPDLGVPHRDETCHLEFNLDGTLLASGSSDNTVKLWDVAAMSLLLRLPVSTESAVIPAFQPGGRLLAIGSSEGVMLHELLGQNVCTTRALSHTIVEDFAFLPSGGTDYSTPIATLRSNSGTADAGELAVEIWPGASRLPRQTLALGIRGRIGPSIRLEVQPADREILVRHGAGLLAIHLDASDKSHQSSLEVPTVSACWSPDGTCLWGITEDDRVISWKLPDLKERTQWNYQPPSSTKGRAGLSSLAAGRQWVVAGTRAKALLFVRAADGQFDHAALATKPVTAVALSPDERVAVCGTKCGGLDLVRVQDGQVLTQVKVHAEMITEIAFHPSGDYFATNSRDRNVVLWRLGPSSITELMRFRAPSGRAASAIHYSSDGQSLGILIAQERAVRVWNLSRLHQELRTLGLDWGADSDSPDPTPKP